MNRSISASDKRAQKLRRFQDDSERPSKEGISQVFLWAGRILVIGLLAYSPWVYGMVTFGQQLLLIPWMSLILVMTWLFLIQSTQVRFHLSPLVVSLCLLLMLALAQVIPLPEFLYQKLAPSAKFESAAVARAAEYLSIAPSDSALLEVSRNTGPKHKTVSICPTQTRASIVGLASALIVMICSSLLFQDAVGKKLLIISISLISACVSIIGVMQAISWNQWTLIGETYDRGFATFVSGNTAPQYLAVGVGSTIALAMAWVAQKRRKSRHGKRYRANDWVTRVRNASDDFFRQLDAVLILVAVAIVIQIAGVIAAASRGGFVTMLFALFVTLLLTLGRSQRIQISGILGAGVLAALVLIFSNSMELNEEIFLRLEHEGLRSQLRLEFWKLALSQSEFWLTGCGLGNFHFAIMNANVAHPYWIYHAESMFVELISVLGFPGFVTGVAGLAWLLIRILRRPEVRSTKLWPAVTYSVCAISLHSLVDFSLIIPAVFLTLCALVGAYLGELAQSKDLPNQSAAGAVAFRKSKLKATAIFVVLAIALWQGFWPLIGFAQAERIEAQDWDSRAESLIISKFLPTKLDLNHPEVVLQLAINKCVAIEDRLINSLPWSDDVTPKEKADYSRLEFVAAIMRSSNRQDWVKQKEIWSSDRGLIAAIDAALKGFEFVSSCNAYDWRSHRGQYKTSIAVDKLRHALICARLQILTDSIPSLQQAVGTCELLAQNEAIGNHYWKNCLINHPEETFKLSTLVGNLISYEVVESIVPPGQIPKAVLCRALLQQEETRQIGQKLVEQLDVEKSIREAETEFDWRVVSWLARLRGESSGYTIALRKLAALSPMDKAVRVNLAEALEAAGEIDEAIQTMEQAKRRHTLTVSEEEFLHRLKGKRLTSP